MPEEGEKLYHPTAFPVDSEEQCQVNGEVLSLSCNTFLNVYPTGLTYGRNATLKKDLCDGQHVKATMNLLKSTCFSLLFSFFIEINEKVIFFQISSHNASHE